MGIKVRGRGRSDEFVGQIAIQIPRGVFGLWFDMNEK